MPMNLARALALAAVFTIGLLAGCGGKKSNPVSNPVIAPGLSTVGTLSHESSAQPVIQDANAIRDAMNTGDATNAFNGIYDLINRYSADKSEQHGASTIRRELPTLVGRFTKSYPEVRARVMALKPKTRVGAQMQAYALDLLHDDLVLTQSLNADVARSTVVFFAVDRWGRKTNAVIRKNNARLREMFLSASPKERAAIKKAVRETFGAQVQ